MGVISVSGCQQLSIEAGAFTFGANAKKEQRQLRLRLSDLGWEAVPSEIADWTQVASVDLTSNPLDCNCKLAWLRDVLAAINDTESSSNVFCQQPRSLRGQPLQVAFLMIYSWHSFNAFHTKDYSVCFVSQSHFSLGSTELCAQSHIYPFELLKELGFIGFESRAK